MVPTELLRLTFPDLGALEREIATNIRYGRVFVGEVIDAPVLTEGVIVIVHPHDGRELSLGAQVVMVNSDGPMRGTGIALRSFGPADVERVQAFARGEEEGAAAPPPAPEARARQMTPVPMAAAVSERPRAQTPIPMPATLSDRPRRATPLRPEALTVKPSMAPAAAGTVPPSAPENDWSDLQSSGLVHTAVTYVPPAGDESREENEREDGNEDAHAHGYEDEDGHVHEDEDGHEDEHVHEAADVPLAAAEDDWSDVAAAVAQPVDAETADTDADAAVDDGDAEGLDDDADRPAPTELQQENRQQRLRTLNVVEQLKVARRGELADRVAVERLYGKTVWEALLQNPRLTLPEVARIARKGTVPRPLIEQILENQQWTKAPNVQRALLSNPKLTPEGIVKLLKMIPKHELKIMEKATAYPLSVRDAARKLLREGK